MRWHRRMEASGGVRGEIRILIRSHLWVWWAEIAIDQERIAMDARARALARAEKDDVFSEALTHETRASMIAIAACSHSLDALFGALTEHIEPRRTERRWSEILETLRAGFVIDGSAGGGRWAREFEWLFDLRDAALHFQESQKEPLPHPAGTNAGPEAVMYSLGPAQRAVSFLLEVLATCVANPRPELKGWVEGSRRTVEALFERRTAPE